MYDSIRLDQLPRFQDVYQSIVGHSEIDLINRNTIEEAYFLSQYTIHLHWKIESILKLKLEGQSVDFKSKIENNLQIISNKISTLELKQDYGLFRVEDIVQYHINIKDFDYVMEVYSAIDNIPNRSLQIIRVDNQINSSDVPCIILTFIYASSIIGQIIIGLKKFQDQIEAGNSLLQLSKAASFTEFQNLILNRVNQLSEQNCLYEASHDPVQLVERKNEIKMSFAQRAGEEI